jgi:hypothetical protein
LIDHSIRERCVAVRKVQAARRAVFAVSRGAELAHNARGVVEPDDSAVDDVGDADKAVREHVGVVGVVEIPRFAAWNPLVAITPDDARMAAQRDDGDGLGVLLIGGRVLTVGGEEGVVRPYKLLGGACFMWAGEAPDDSPARTDDDDAVVFTVGDEQVAG